MRAPPEQVERFYHAAYKRFVADPTVENEEELDYWRIIHSAHVADALAARNEMAQAKLR
jgi:hypothetical protein